MTESFFGLTDTGKLRDNNEDTFIAQKVLHNQFIAACVIDGVGGYEGGEVAAQLARDAILDYLRIPSGDVLTMMKEAIKAANEIIYTEKQKEQERQQMACVLTLALIDQKNNQFYYAHVGDTRLYLLRGHSLIKVTKDHSFVGFLEDSGRLSEAEAMSHPKRNEIDKALGFDAQISINADYIETGHSPFLPGDLLLVCSDGLTDLVTNSSMTSILVSEQSLSEKAERLVAAANEAGGKDNITVVLVQNSKKPKKQKATRPIAATAVENNIEKSAVTNSEEEAVDKYEEEAMLQKPVKQVPEKNLPPTVVSKRSNWPVLLLSSLCLLLLVGFLWQTFRNKDKDNRSVTPSGNLRNTGEQQLLDSLNLAPGKTLFLADTIYGKSIRVTDSMSVTKDSLYVYGNGMVLKADSSYLGTGLVFPSSAKYIILEDIVFENFDIAIAAQSRVLQLKNIRFVNCRVPVLYGFQLSGSNAVNGTISDTVFFKKNSSSK